MIYEGKFQIGKNGVTEGVIQSLNNLLKTRNQIRISTLKSLERDRVKIKVIAEEISKRVAYHNSYRIIGFTIILKRKKARIKKIQRKSL